ncbi:ParB-like protein [Curtobacterium sp. Leaf261]|uniref:ParB-like protein n=1 Tax=Curtobacterium sp. Leaf261 TaxID=1736311 RepID=UPI000A945C12|nr:ParB-like protein [Curtobacterium sp. Leaf261]
MPVSRSLRATATTLTFAVALGTAVLAGQSAVAATDPAPTAAAQPTATTSPSATAQPTAATSPSDTAPAASAADVTDTKDPSCTTGDTRPLCVDPDTLLDVRIGDVHPTQPSLGYDEVYYKLGRYSTAIGKDAVDKEFGDWCEANGQTDAVSAQPGATLRDPSTFTCETPVGSETADSIAPMKTVVIGPGGTLYLTDGHHTLTSFAETPDGGLDTHVRLRVLGNLSGLTTADFWTTMQEQKWVWLRDVDGKTITPSQLPSTVGLASFEDDRARSIMYFARDIGYSADGAVPFQEFYWGSWLRAQPAIDLAGWDQDDWDASLALVRQITEAQVALPRDEVVDADSGYTAADLSTFTAWNDGKKETKGEWAKLAVPYSDAKPGKLAYMVEYRKTLASTPPTDPTPTDPTPTPTPTDPVPTPTNPVPTPTDPTTVQGTVVVSGRIVPGGTVTISGSGFAASTTGFRVELRSDPVLLGTVGTDASGTFSLTTTVPAGTSAGAHSVVVLLDGVQVGATAVTVAIDPGQNGTGQNGTGPNGAGNAGSGSATGALAFTGTEGVAALLVAALAAIVAGATIRTARRRGRAD